LKWKDYLDDFSSSLLQNDLILQEYIIKIAIWKIIENRGKIKRIKEGVNL